MATAGQTMLGMDRVKPRRSDPVIEVRRSPKLHSGPLLRKVVAPRPSAAALKPPPPVAPVPTPLVLDDVFQRVTTRRHTLRLAQVWARLPAGEALIETERAAVWLMSAPNWSGRVLAAHLEQRRRSGRNWATYCSASSGGEYFLPNDVTVG